MWSLLAEQQLRVHAKWLVIPQWNGWWFHSGMESNMQPCVIRVYQPLEIFPFHFLTVPSHLLTPGRFPEAVSQKALVLDADSIKWVTYSELCLLLYVQMMVHQCQVVATKKHIKTGCDVDARKRQACKTLPFLLGPRTLTVLIYVIQEACACSRNAMVVSY